MAPLAKAPLPQQPLLPKTLQAPPARAKRDWGAEITTTVGKPRPPVIIISGVPGIGKTSMAAYSDSPIFICDDKEDGISTLKERGLVPNVPRMPLISNWPDTLDATEYLLSSSHNYKTAVFDAIGGFERLMHEEVCRRDYKNDWTEKGFVGFQRGADTSLADMRTFMNLIDRLRDERGMTIVLLSHIAVTTFKNPEGPDYDRYTSDVNKKTWTLLNKWAEIVLFANYVTHVESRGLDKKGKAIDGQTSVLYTQRHASYDAKNRHNLPHEISMGSSGQEAWQNFMQAIEDGRVTQ